MYMNEEKVKVSIILKYFRELGFQEDELEVETNFKIMIPREGTKLIENRIEKNVFSDIVYRRKSVDISQNVFLVEVKREGHKITDKDIDQGICYARLLEEMAPFTIITNSRETKIFDTITKKDITDNILDSSYIKNKFQITLDEELKSEALRIFYGLNPNNLINYCKLQRESNLRDIMSIEHSARAVVERLHCHRTKYVENFYDFLQSCAKVYSIIGRSGAGKTNQVYSIIKKYENEYPILFYNAGLLGKSLENTLLSDFSFLLSRDYQFQDLMYRLDSICSQINREILIFIDGLDENNNRQELTSELNDLTKKFYNKHFRFIFSCKISDEQNDVWHEFTHYKGAVNFLGENTYSIKELNYQGKIGVFLDKLSEDEINTFWEKYSKGFNITGELNGELRNLAKEPFIMRIIAESYKDTAIDTTIDEFNLYKKWIDIKTGFSSDMELLKFILCNVSEKIIVSNVNTIFYEDVLHDLISISDINQKIKLLLSLGILRITNDKKDNKYLSFPNDNLLYYVYTVLSQKWHNKKIYELQSIFNNNINNNIFRASVIFFISIMQKSYEIEQTNWNEQADININKECKVCGKFITRDEFITLVFDMILLNVSTTSNNNIFSIAHNHCIPKNFPLLSKFPVKDSFPASCSDLLAIRNIINFMKFTPEKELDKINKEITDALNKSKEIEEEYYSSIYPDEKDIGTPFWVLMEIIDSKNTGNIFYRYCDEKPTLVLFEKKEFAQHFLKSINLNNNNFLSYQVRGINSLYEKELLIAITENERHALVCVGFDNEKAVTIKLNPYEVKEICQEQIGVLEYFKRKKGKVL